MRKVVRRMKQTISVLLAIAMIATAVPSMGLDVYASEIDGKVAESGQTNEPENVNTSGTEETIELPAASAVPTETPKETGTPEATESPSAEVTPEATESPSAEVTPEATESPSAEVTPEATESPSAEVTPEATESPSPEVTPGATATPSTEPTASPTGSPINSLTANAKTQVSVSLLPTEAGYHSVSLRAEITNPGSETISKLCFSVTGTNTQKDLNGDWIWEGSKQSDTVYGASYSFGTNDTIEVTPYVCVGEEADAVTVKGEPVKISCRPAENLTAMLEAGTFEATANTASVTVSYDFEIDTNEGFYLQCEGGGSTSKDYISSTKGILKGSCSFSLKPDTEYNLTFKIASDYNASKVYFEKKVTIKTGEEVTYTEADIPDATLRAAIQKEIGTGNALTSTNLEKITFFSWSATRLASLNVSSTIKDLKGIELLTNLTSLILDGHDFTDISPVTGLKKLTYLYLEENNINAIPDLSGLTGLEYIYLDGNKIPQAEFTDDKMPVSLLSSQSYWKNFSKNQRTEETLVKAAVYPVTGGQAFLYVEIPGGRYSSREWTVSATIDGSTYELSRATSYSSSSVYYYCAGYFKLIPATEGTYSATFKAQESYGGKTLEETGEIQLEDVEGYVDYQRYLEPGDGSVKFEVSLPVQEGETPTSAKLVSEETGKVAGRSTSSLSTSTYGKPTFWPSVFKSCPSAATQLWQRVSGYVTLSSVALEGSYDLIITTNKSEYVFENYAVSDYENPYITDVYYNSEYDNEGEYYHVTVYGEALDYDGFYPELKLADGTVVTEFVSRNGKTFKLKKLSGFPDNENVNVTYAVREGYPEVRWSGEAAGMYAYTGNNIITVVYNAKAKKYLLYASSLLLPGTEISLGLNKGYLQFSDGEYQYTNKVASAVVVTAGSETEVNFLDANGAFYELPRDTYYNHYYGAVWTDNGTTVNQSSIITYRESGFGKDESGTGTGTEIGDDYLTIVQPVNCYRVGSEIPIEVKVYNNTKWTKEDTITVTIRKTDSDAVLSERTLKPVISGSTATFKDSFPADAVSAEGEYTVTVTNEKFGVSVERQITMIGSGVFFQTSQYSSTISDSDGLKKAVVDISTVDAEKLDINKFAVSFYDMNYDPVTDVELIQKTKTISNYGGYDSVQFIFDGLIGKYGTLFCKVTYDGEVGLAIDTSSGTYYETRNADPNYGILSTWYSSLSFGFSYGRGYCLVDSSYYEDYTVEIRENRTGELISSFQVNKKGLYFFTRADLSDVLAVDPELKQLYQLVARKDGKVLATQRHVNIGYFGNDTAPTGVTLSPASAAMQKGDVLQLTTALKPASAYSNLTYTSSNTEVATVNNRGMVTAVGAGSAKITVKTANGKSAVCNVTVFDYKLSESSVTLNVGDDEKEIAVYNGDTRVTQKITWSSSDPSVAAVAGGKVTAKKRGTATITAEISGIKLTCEVRVTSEIRSLTLLSERNLLETGGDQDTLRLLCSPAAGASDASFEWTTSDADIAAVENGVVTTGNKTGNVTITVKTISSDTGSIISASKNYTVEKKDAITGLEKAVTLYAVTNTDTALKDLASGLPAGWQWENGETRLAAFADRKEKEFTVVHKNEITGVEYRDTVVVKFTTINSIELQADDETVTKLLEGQKVNASIKYTVTGEKENPRLSEITYKVSYAPKSKEDVVTATLTNEAEGKVELAGIKAGNATLALTMYSGGEEVYTGTQKLTVAADKKGNGIVNIDYALQYKAGEEYKDLQPDEDGSYTIRKENG